MKTQFWIPALAICVAGSGCLKSRYSLKGEEEEPAAPRQMQAKVEEVPPSGGYAVEELKSEVTRLAGRIEDLERDKRAESGKVSASTREELKKLESRIAELEQAQANMIEAIKKLEEAPPADAESLLDKGKSLFESGKYEGAVDALGAYLKTSKPRKPEQATFLRGEAYYKLKQYKKAIVDYSKFPEKYVKSSFMPQALYKIGLSFDNLGMREDAKGFYQELVDKFPKSAEGKKARAKLK